ncbi:5'-methylthioadenosine nucleosidase [Salinibacter sp. 10B]|uniref:phosphorylase family protein n=1 Tax=Salinibacter sp. 10B TaxID=1923971 RepID=UPI000CF57198|nr:5'-methylthioadenosine nucleosidase [Salinibacter sp. 10B]PQJ35727.1 5'-methylthioadenosine nucleosidase [Salinibacter sp. 10B]
MLGIVFTTPDDATTFLQQHTAGRTDRLEEDTPLPLGNLLVVVTGPGKIKATLATERLLQSHDPDTLIHTGRCTALSADVSVDTVVGASFVLEGDRVELDAPTYPRMPLSCPYDVEREGTLVSQDHTPNGEDDSLNYWARLADVRDSTSYAVAYVAAQHGTPCHVAKVVYSSLNAETSPASAPSETIASFLSGAIDTADLPTE